MLAPLLVVSLLAVAPAPPAFAPRSDAQLAELTLRELALERNRVFARHGRAFRTPWVKAHFEAQPWYRVSASYSDASLSAAEKTYVRRVKTVENHIDPAALRVRRNTVFAKHGRMFKSQDLKEHFNKQPWYKPDPAYTDARLTPEDKIEIELIQQLEAQASAAPHLDAWEPGRTLTEQQVAGAELTALFTLYVKMTREMNVKGYDQTQCDFVEAFFEGVDDLCTTYRKAKKRRKDLPPPDRRTLRTVEQALAARWAKDRLETAKYDVTREGVEAMCWESCEDMGEGVDKPRCARCKRGEKSAAKERLQLARARLGKVKKGEHPVGSELFDEVASVFLESAA